MTGYYSNILKEKTGRDFPPGITIFLFISMIGLPLALGYGVDDYRVALGVLILAVGLAGLVLFYNVRTFGFLIMPIFFILIFNMVYLSLIVLLVTTFLAEKTNSGDFSLEIPYPFLLVTLLTFGAMGMLKAVDRDMGRFYYQYSFVFPVIAFLIYYNLKPTVKNIKSFLTIAAGTTAINGWISLFMWLQTGIPRQLFRWGSQNAGACFFGMVLPISLMLLIDARDKQSRVIYSIIFIGILAGIIVTQTRAVLLSLFVAVVYLALKDRRILKVILPAILVAGIALPGLIIYRIALFFGVGGTPDWSSVGRVEIWLNSLEYIPKYFWFGMGIDSFRWLYPVDFPYGFLMAEHPHNMFIKWLFDLGIFGVSAYLMIIFRTLLRSMRAVKAFLHPDVEDERRLLLGINAGLISGLVASMVDSTLHQLPTSFFIWTMLAFMLVLLSRIEHSPEFSGSTKISTPLIDKLRIASRE